MIDRLWTLAETDRQRVDEHVAGCEACQAYRHLADRLRGLLVGLPVPPDREVHAAFQKLQARSRRDRRGVVLGISVAATSFLGLLWFARIGLPTPGMVVLLAWLVAGAGYAWWLSRRAAWATAHANDHDFRSRWQRDLDWRIRLIVVVDVVLGMEILAIAAFLALGDSDAALVLGAVTLMIAVGVGHSLVVELPALRREKAWLQAQE